MAGPQDDLPTAARRENHRALSSPQTVIADESNATFKANTKAEACIADAVIRNSPSGALLTHQRSGEYTGKFKDPKTGESVEISGREDVGRMIGVRAEVETVPGTLDQFPAGAKMHLDEDGKLGEPSSREGLGPLAGSPAAIKRADAMATQVRQCMDSSTQPSRVLKKPFFTP
jgi:hypothetical protein